MEVKKPKSKRQAQYERFCDDARADGPIEAMTVVLAALRRAKRKVRDARVRHYIYTRTDSSTS